MGKEMMGKMGCYVRDGKEKQTSVFGLFNRCMDGCGS